MSRKELRSALRKPKKVDAESEADPLLVFLQDLSAEDAQEWHAVLLERRVRSRDSLLHMAQAEEAWHSFYTALAQQEPVFAAELNAWRLGLGLQKPSGGDSPGKEPRLIFPLWLSRCRLFALMPSFTWALLHAVRV